MIQLDPTLLKNAHKFWSVRIASLVALVALLEPHLPALAAALPPSWAAYGVAAIAIARVVRQNIGAAK